MNKKKAEDEGLAKYKNLLVQCRQEFVRIVKFSVVGVSNTIVSYVTYAVCIYFGMHYLLANALGFLTGTTNAFFGNKKFVFTQAGKTVHPLIVYFKTLTAYAVMGLGVNSILSYVLIDVFSISKYLAPIGIALITVPGNYVLNRFWAMRR